MVVLAVVDSEVVAVRLHFAGTADRPALTVTLELDPPAAGGLPTVRAVGVEID